MNELKRLIELLDGAFGDLERMRAAMDGFRQTDVADIERLRKAVKILLDRLEESHASVREHLGESAEIVKRLDAQGDKPIVGVPATDLAKGFRSVIQTIQREVAEGDVGDVGTIIRSMDVELKGLIGVENMQPTLVSPALDQPIDANQLSTIRMSFASVPIERATAVNRDAAPATPAEPATSAEPATPRPAPRAPGSTPRPRRSRRGGQPG